MHVLLLFVLRTITFINKNNKSSIIVNLKLDLLESYGFTF